MASHSRWVRTTHWSAALAFLVLVVSGIEILMVHPRLYWGEAGNDLMDTAWLELPISRNHDHDGIREVTPFFDRPDSPVSAVVSYDMFNQNGWGRSLHFLAAWVLVAAGLVYWFAGFARGHVRRHLVPGREAFDRAEWAREVRNHLRLRIPPATGGPDYGLLQRTSYLAIVFVCLPLMAVTGFAMAPALSASFPFLTGLFGGLQSARSVHFLAFIALLGFLVVHIAMVILSGFRAQMRGMTLGGRSDG